MNRSPLKLATAAACAAVLTLALAGCGGDDKDEPKAADPTSTLDPVTAGYAEQVEPICTKAAEDLQAISEPFGTDEPTDAQFTEGLEKGSAVLLAEVASIRAVETPAELTDRVDGWLAALEKAAKGLPKLTKADARKGVDAFADSDPLARDLGLTACTSNGQ